MPEPRSDKWMHLIFTPMHAQFIPDAYLMHSRFMSDAYPDASIIKGGFSKRGYSHVIRTLTTCLAP